MVDQVRNDISDFKITDATTHVLVKENGKRERKFEM